MDKLAKLVSNKQTLIVCENNEAIKYLIKNFDNVFKNNLVNVSYILLSELISKLNFICDDKVILEIMSEFNFNYDSAKMYCDNICLCDYLLSKNVFNEKMEIVLKIKNHLIEKNMFKKDPYIDSYLSDKSIILYTKELDDFHKYLLRNIDYLYLPLVNSDNEDVNLDLFSFNSVEEEIAYVCESIIDKLKSGVYGDDIYLVCSSKDYLYPLKRISKYFDLSFDINEKTSLTNINFANKLIDLYFENKLSEIDYSLFNEEEFNIYKKLINVINKYVSLSDYKSFNEFLKYKLSEECISKRKYSNSIKLISLNEAFYLLKYNKKAYVYILALYQGNIPSLKKDEDYFSDSLKKENNIFDSAKLNLLEISFVKDLFKNGDNIHLSYSKKSNFNEYSISGIINYVNFNVINKSFYISKYSNKYNLEMYYKLYDAFAKYAYKNNELLALHASYNDSTYGTYNNKFKGVDNYKILDKLNGKISLSYSSLNTLNKCAFSYYLKYILSLSEYEDNFMTFIGNVFHYCIEKHFKDANLLIDDLYEEAILAYSDKYQMTIGEKHLISNLKFELQDVIKYLDEQLVYINYKDAMFEQKIEVDSKIDYSNNEIKTKFIGFVDKLLYKKVKDEFGNDITLVCIIDYKTSTSIKFEIELVKHGLSLQLPIYAFLANNIKGFDNVIVGGMFIQPILNSTLIDVEGDSVKFEKKKSDSKKLNGCINDELRDEYKFTNYDIYSKTSKLNTEDFNKLNNDVIDSINKAFITIASGDFKINPKRINNNNVTCSYCKFKDVCYFKESDYVDIVLEKEDL